MLKSPRRLLTAIAIMTVIGCGDDATDPSGTITVSASPTSLTLPQGGSGTVTVTLVRGGGFDDPVNVAVSGLPTGVTTTLNPTQLTGNTLQATVTVNVANTVAAGTYTATITASAAGVGNATTTYTLTVTAQDFTLSANPVTVSIPQGGSGTSTINIARTNFTGDVALSLVNPPTGITGTFNPTNANGTSSQLTINVAGTVAAGNQTLTVQGTGGGATKTTTVTVTVTQPAGANQTWDFCATDDLPLKFWKLDGGTWSEVTSTTVGNIRRYTFTISSVQGGVAFTVSNTSFASLRQTLTSSTQSGFRSVSRQTRFKALENRMKLRNQTVNQSSPFFDTFVFFALASELGNFAETCQTAPTTVSKTFNVSNQSASEEGLLGYGGAVTSLVSTTPSYNLNVVAGTHDWLALWGPVPSFPDLTHQWNAYRIGRNEVAPGAPVAVNRTGAPAFVTFPFTVSGGAASSLWNFSQNLEGANGEVGSFPIGSLISTSGAGTMLFPQPADRLATDLWSLNMTNTELVGNNIDSRTQVRYVGSAPPASGNFALPAAVPPFTTSQVNGAPVTSWQATGSTPTDYQTPLSVVSASFTGAGGNALYTIAASRGWQTANNMSTSYTLVSPTLPGSLPAWAPAAPLDDATVIMVGTNATTVPTAGTIANIAFRLQAP